MTPESVLARATAKGGQYESYIAGGLTAFSSAEVGHALAGFLRDDGHFDVLPEGAVRVILLRYAGGDSLDAFLLVKALFKSLAGQRMNWESRVARTLVCRVAVQEYILATRCNWCVGRGTQVINDLVEPCSRCDGSGYTQTSAFARANDLGLPMTTFRGGPAERLYVDRMRQLAQWEEIGLRRVVAKIKN